MEVKQIYQLANTATKEAIGDSAVLNEDLSNLVDVGKAIFDAEAVDQYVKKLVNQVYDIVFVTKVYKGSAPSVLMEQWEYGSVKEKIRTVMPEAQENESWQLDDGHSYDQDVFVAPKVSVKFYNDMKTLEIDRSYATKQVMQSFQNATQLNAFLSMLQNDVEKSFTVKLDELIRRTINNMIAQSLFSEYQGQGYDKRSGQRAVNLLYLYNQATGKKLTKDKCLYDGDFIRFASREISLYQDRLSSLSVMYNLGHCQNFTNKEDQRLVLLSEFDKSARTYLYSDTRHENYVLLPNAETVPYWQGSGQDFEFASTSKIDVKDATNDVVTVDGIIGVLFDKYALGVSKLDRRTTSHPNAKAEFTNYFYKMDVGFFNDFNENFVVFFVA